MIYLLLAILCGSLFSIVFKLGQRHGADGLQVIFINYLVAFVFTLLPIAARVAFNHSVSAGDYVPGPSSWLLGVVQGALFVAGFVVMERSTRRSGVALTTVCARASLILPVLLSWMLLGQPAPAWLPVLLTVAALVLIVGPAGSAHSKRQDDSSNDSSGILSSAVLVLLGVFLVIGFSDFFLKIVQHTVEKTHADNPALMESRLSGLTCIIFMMATIAALLVCLLSGSFRKHKVTWSTVGWGALLGVANIGCTSAMLRALGVMPTGLYYPLYNIGIVLVATLAGLLLFGERLNWRQAAGLVLAIVAIAFSF